MGVNRQLFFLTQILFLNFLEKLEMKQRNSITQEHNNLLGKPLIKSLKDFTNVKTHGLEIVKLESNIKRKVYKFIQSMLSRSLTSQYLYQYLHLLHNTMCALNGHLNAFRRYRTLLQTQEKELYTFLKSWNTEKITTLFLKFRIKKRKRFFKHNSYRDET